MMTEQTNSYRFHESFDFRGNNLMPQLASPNVVLPAAIANNSSLYGSQQPQLAESFALQELTRLFSGSSQDRLQELFQVRSEVE